MLNVTLLNPSRLGRTEPFGGNYPRQRTEAGQQAVAFRGLQQDAFSVNGGLLRDLRALERVRFGTDAGFTYLKRYNIVNELKHRAWKSHNGIALRVSSPLATDANQELTVKNYDLYNDVRRLTRVLREEYHIQPGDRIAAVESNSPEFVTLFYATLAAGATLAAVNVAAMADQPESLIHMLKLSKAKMLFVGKDPAFEKVQQLKQLEQLLNPKIQKLIKGIPQWVHNLMPSWMPVMGKLKKGNAALHDPVHSKIINALPPNMKIVLPKDGVFENLKETAPMSESGMTLTPDPDQDALILFTSGTEALPKAVPISHKALIHNTIYLRERSTEALQGSNASLMMALPMFHIFGMAVFQVGMTSDVPIVLGPLPKAENIPKLLDIIEKEKPTMFPIIPGTLKKMLALPGALEKMKSLNTIITGGDKLSRDVYDALLQGIPGLKMWEGYGMTEIGILTLNTSGQYGNVGTPISPHIKVELRRSLEDGLPASIEEQKVETGEGELWAHTPSLGRTYEGAAQEKIDELFKPGGWAKTGDIAMLGVDNAISLTGRSKDTYKRNGEYTPMGRVNTYFSQLPDVKGAFSFPHKVGGDPEEKIISMIILKPGSTQTAQGLRQGLQKMVDNKQMAPRFLPHYTMVLPGDDFPSNFVGTDGKMKPKNARALLDRLQKDNAVTLANGEIKLVRPEVMVS